MRYELSDDYLEDARRRAYRFQGQWCGTSGSLAADVARLLVERKRMTEDIATLEDANAKLRAAVQGRLAGTPADDPKMHGYVPAAEACCDGGRCHAKPAEETPQEIPADWILQGQKELQTHRDDIRWTGDSLLRDGETFPAEELLQETLDVVRDRRPKYGGPMTHFRKTVGMINAAFGDILRRPLTESDWAQFMLLDKVARYNGPAKTTDGPVDMAGYAACLAECEAAIRPAE